jgi:hypothetical protein
MSQRSKTIHEFSAINLAQSTLTLTSVTGAKTLLTGDSGDFFSLNATSGCTITLPAPSSGLVFNFLVNNTGAHTLVAPSACIVGSVSNAVANTGASLATGVAKTIVSTTSGSAVGDSITLIGNSSKYFLQGNVSEYNAVTFT